MIVWLSAAIGLGLVVALIARTKGGALLPWWIYGTVLAPIALPHALMLRGMSQPDWRPERFGFLEQSEPPKDRCPHCGVPLHPEAVVCLRCGRAIYDPGSVEVKADQNHDHERSSQGLRARAGTALALKSSREEVPRQWEDGFGRLAEGERNAPPPEPAAIPQVEPSDEPRGLGSTELEDDDEAPENAASSRRKNRRSWADLVPAAHGRLVGELSAPGRRRWGAIAGTACAGALVIGAVAFAWREAPRYSELPASAPTDPASGTARPDAKIPGTEPRSGSFAGPRGQAVIPSNPPSSPAPSMNRRSANDEVAQQSEEEKAQPKFGADPGSADSLSGESQDESVASKTTTPHQLGTKSTEQVTTEERASPQTVAKEDSQEKSDSAPTPMARTKQANAPGRSGTQPAANVEATAAHVLSQDAARLTQKSQARDDVDEIARAMAPSAPPTSSAEQRTVAAAEPAPRASEGKNAQNKKSPIGHPQETLAAVKPTSPPQRNHAAEKPRVHNAVPKSKPAPEPEPETPTVFANIVQRALRDIFGERVNSSGSVRPAAVSPRALISTPDGSEASEQSVTASGEIVAMVQRRLRERGFDPGPVDGRAGGRTRAAILAFEQASGVPQRGKIDLPLLQRLGIVGAEIRAFTQ